MLLSKIKVINQRKTEEVTLFIYKSMTTIYKNLVHKDHSVIPDPELYKYSQASGIESLKMRPTEKCEFHSVCTLLQAISVLKYIHICICCTCIKKPIRYLRDEEIGGLGIQ